LVVSKTLSSQNYLSGPEKAPPYKCHVQDDGTVYKVFFLAITAQCALSRKQFSWQSVHNHTVCYRALQCALLATQTHNSEHTH